MPEQELNGEDKESSHYYHITANTVQSLVEHMTTEGAQSKLHSLLDQLAEDTDPDRMLTFLYEKCRSILDECLPKVKKAPSRPTAARSRNRWFDDDCRKRRRELRNLGKKALKDEQCRQSFLEAKRLYKQLIRNKKRTFQTQAIKSLENLRRNDSRGFWQTIKPRRRVRTGAIFPKGEWFNYFQRVVGIGNQFESRHTHDAEGTIEVMELNRPIDTNEIRGAIGKLKTGKAAGSDGIPVEFLKCGGEPLSTGLKLIFNAILMSGTFPNEWKSSIIVPIPKCTTPTYFSRSIPRDQPHQCNKQMLL